MSKHRNKAHAYYSRYLDGYYVNSNEEKGFFWDKEDSRYVIKVNDRSLRKANKILLKECKVDCFYTFSKHSEEFLDLVVEVKEPRWLTPYVRSIYDELLSEDLAFTIEAVCGNKVIGGLFGVASGKVLTIDTLAGLPEPKEYRSTSKAALCKLVSLAHDEGIYLIDGELKHDKGHPASKLGEEEMEFSEFRAFLVEHSKIRNKFVKAFKGKTLK